MIVRVASCVRDHGHPHTRLVAEDASAAAEADRDPLRAVGGWRRARRVWKQLFAVLPGDIDVEVEVAQRARLRSAASRCSPRDAASRSHASGRRRCADHHVVARSLRGARRRSTAAARSSRRRGSNRRSSTAPAMRVRRMRSRGALSPRCADREHRVRRRRPRGDAGATCSPTSTSPRATSAARKPTVRRSSTSSTARFGQTLIWLGDVLGDVPRHHIMMYMVPLDDHTIAVGDVRGGRRAALRSIARPRRRRRSQARRFDHAAELLAARGFKRRARARRSCSPAAGSFVTYTNALFDRRGDQRIVYLPTYAQPALDDAAQSFYEAQGFEVHPHRRLEDLSPQRLARLSRQRARERMIG